MNPRILSLWLAGVSLVGCGGPAFVMPGGPLSGAIKPVPRDFTFADSAGTIQLETNPTAPYSVNISCAVIAGTLYINAGDTRTSWVANIEDDPRVRVRISGDLYELQADRLTDPVVLDQFAEAWTRKHGWWARDPRKLDEVWIYRLSAR